MVFVGPTGCGKNTLLGMIAGLEGISGGKLRIDQYGNMAFGAPPMNLADCTVQGGAADLRGICQPLPAALGALLNGAQALRFGVRSENIALAAQAADDIAVPTTVCFLELLGAETLATLKVGAAAMVARCQASFRHPPSTPITVHISLRPMQLFNARTGAALA